MIKKIIITSVTIILSIFILNLILTIYFGLVQHKNIFSWETYKRKNYSIEEIMNFYNYRPPQGLKYIKEPAILILGCGFANNIELNDNETIDAYLSRETKRTVYNRAMGGAGIQHAILQVRTGRINDIIKKSDTAIFILPAINDCIRLHVVAGGLTDALFDNYIYPVLKKDCPRKFRDKERERNFGVATLKGEHLHGDDESAVKCDTRLDKNNNLVLNTTKIPYIKGSVLYRLISKAFITGLYTQKFKNNNKYYSNITNTKEYLIVLNNELKAINPNIKMILFLYFDSVKNEPLLQNLKTELEKNGIGYIESSDILDNVNLTDDKYRTPITRSASDEAWKILVPGLADKLSERKEISRQRNFRRVKSSESE